MAAVRAYVFDAPGTVRTKPRHRPTKMTNDQERDLEVEATVILTAAGYAREYTGGNCEAWRRDIAPGRYVWIAYDGVYAFGDPDDNSWTVGLFDSESGEQLDDTSTGLVRLASALDIARQWENQT